MYQLFARLNAARRSAITSHPPFLTTLLHSHQLNNHSLAISKPPLLSILTNHGSTMLAISIYISPQQTGFKPMLPIIDVLSGQIFSTDPRGGLSIPIIAGEPRVFLPLAVYRGEANAEIWQAPPARVDIDTVSSGRSGSGSTSPRSPGSGRSLGEGRKRPGFGSVIGFFGSRSGSGGGGGKGDL